MIYALIGFAVVVIAFLGWRITSVERGARQRDAKLLEVLDPIADKIAKREPVTAEEVAALCRQPQYRQMLYQMLKHHERLDLFPEGALSIVAQGEGVLSYWMMHPNELEDSPSEIELVEEVERDLQGERGKFLVYRYRMPHGHWAESDGWMLGLAGPFLESDLPYSGIATGCARFGDKHGEVNPSELVDWYISLVARKSA